MSDVLTPGPTRIVLIRAGQYDYADISLGKSAHLVGRNNVGKTSLISALQFLYIDDERSMNFSRGIVETKRYYFQHDTSYILFECVSADGRFITVGMRGTGHIGGYGIERFIYIGSYKKSDFIDEQNRVLDFDSVKTNLAGKGFALMSTKDIRDSLLGNVDGKGISLGIVPLQDAGRYKDFVDLFKNILHLSDLGQQEIKDTLLSVNRRDLHGGKSEINLANEYDSLVSQLNTEKEKLAALERVEPVIENMKAARERRDIARRDLPALHAALSLAKTSTTAAIAARRAGHEQDAGQSESTMKGINSKISDAETQRDGLSGQKGVAEHELDALDKLGREFESYLPQMEVQSIQNMDAEIAVMAGKIHNVQPVAELSREIGALEAEIWQYEDKRNHHADLLGTRLVGAGQEIHDVFRLINPGILGLRTGTEITITDERAMLQGLAGIRERITDGVFHGEGISVPLDAIAAPGSVSAISVPDLDALIADKNGILEKKKVALEDARNVEKIRKERDILQGERDTAMQKAERYRVFTEKNAGRGKLVAQITTLSGLLQKNAGERASLTGEQLKLRDRLATANEGIRAAEQEMRRALAVTFRTPEASWKVGAPDPTWGEDLYALRDLYDRTFREYDEMDAESSRILRQIGLIAPDIVRGASQEERMNACEEALNSLAEHRGAYAELLSKVVIGMRSTFDGMLRALEAIKGRGAELNKRLGQLKVSNLRNLKVEIFEIEEQTRFYRSVVDSGSNDLLADVGATEAAVKRIHDKISKAPVLRLSDWFGVRFVVENGRGETKRYDDLAAIESNGTTMTIKLLVNIILIKSLMRSKRPCMIPFWIDEAAQIDPDNLREIVELANENGFCPVLASTNSMSVAEHIYAIQLNEHGRSLIVGGSHLRRVPKASNEPAAA